VGRRRGVRAVVAVASGLAMLALSGCSSADVGTLKRLGMPTPVTDRAHYTLSLWQGAWIAAFVVGGLVWGLIIFASVHYRKRDESAPPQLRYHLPIEMLYTFVPLVTIGALFFFTVRTQDRVLAPTPHPQQKITVVGQQWSWTFNYYAKKTVGAVVFDKGDTKRLPVLWLPKCETIAVTLHSADVDHSFWVPHFLFKMDVLAGRDNHFDFTPTTLGTFQGKCAEMCGAYHSKMLFVVKIVTPEQFNAHLRKLKAMGQIGPALGGEGVDTVDGLESAQGGSEQ
jgi:cytochrome c oxidase subunit 2